MSRYRQTIEVKQVRQRAIATRCLCVKAKVETVGNVLSSASERFMTAHSGTLLAISNASSSLRRAALACKQPRHPPLAQSPSTHRLLRTISTLQRKDVLPSELSTSAEVVYLRAVHPQGPHQLLYQGSVSDQSPIPELDFTSPEHPRQDLRPTSLLHTS
eukprot:760471-Hanusia_phi.AAC.5